MSGFLASLAARSTGQERVLEPRSLLFEPRDELPLEPDPVAPRSAPNPRAAPRDERKRPPVPRRDDMPLSGRAPAEEKRLAVPAYEQRPAHTPQQPQVPDAPPRRAAERRLLRPEPMPGPGAAPAVSTPTIPAGVPAPAEGTSRLPVRAAPAAPPPPTPRSKIRRTAAALPAEEQVVRITIGRVEVRAVQEAAPVRRRRPPAPARMTLAEYLAGGRRP
jgi:hypothetical protein